MHVFLLFYCLCSFLIVDVRAGSIYPKAQESEKSWNTLGTWNKTDDGMTLLIPYTFSDAVNYAPKWEQLRDNVAEAVDYFWETKIRFKEYDLTDLVKQKISYITITDFIRVGSVGCSSDVGPSLPSPEVAIIEIGREECYKKVGMIAHQFMHALGFLHEHQRADREKYVTLKTKFSYLKNHSDYRIRKDNEETIIDSYDFESIMHYDLQYLKLTRLSKYLLSRRQQKNIGKLRKLSDGDVDMINKVFVPGITCTCPNGNPISDPLCSTDRKEHCESCDRGFHLNGISCSQNFCYCPHGQPVAFYDCIHHRRRQCVYGSCDKGYHYWNGVCQTNV